MMTKTVLLLAVVAGLAAVPAVAQTPVQLPRFDQVELSGGGRVVVRHGPVQQVRLVRGDPGISRLEVDRQGRLRIDACRRTCRDYRLEVEIVTPSLAGVAVRGGGEIAAQGAFPAQPRLAAAVTGGGCIDARAFDARQVAAAISGGGSILADPTGSLTAAVRGGGAIRYWGNPRVTRTVSGGGSVSRAGGR